MYNSFGNLFRFTTWGESHGKAIGCVVDGCPAGIELSESDIQPFLDKRRPGQSKMTTQRQEKDQVEILSGVFEGKTTGTPISLIIHNTDQKSKDYGDIKDKYRPGHADYTYDVKYGHRDYRGGGRSSARETAMRVAAGAIARKILNHLSHGDRSESAQRDTGEGIKIRAAMVQMGDHKVPTDAYDWAQVDENDFFCPHAEIAEKWAEELKAIRKEGSSVGAVIEVQAENIPAGLGEPIYKKLDTEIASAMMSINAVKGVEIGDGFASAALNGQQNADEIRIKDGKPHFASNHAGGILGGISTGQPLIARFVVKPTSSILTAVNTINAQGEECEIQTKGRHDPCVGIRAVPVGEAMMACVLADHLLMHRARQN